MSTKSTPSQSLHTEGQAFASQQILLASPAHLRAFRQRVLHAAGAAFALAKYAEEQMRSRPQPTELPGLQRLEENTRLLRSSAMEVQGALRPLCKLPFAREANGVDAPRIFGVANALLQAAHFHWTLPEFSSFLLGFQTNEPLNLREFWNMPVALKFVLLEEVLTQAARVYGNSPVNDTALDAAMRSLYETSLPLWSNILEPLVPFDPILRQDPTGTYGRMDFESRELYRLAVEQIAARSPMREFEVAQTALNMARQNTQIPREDARITERQSHIGYFLVDAGRQELAARCGFRPAILDRIRAWLRKYPDDFYIVGIQTIALLAMAAIILPLVPFYNPLGTLALAFFLLLLPVSQFAVELMNHTVAAILKPQALPKLDFSGGVPADCKTLVAVPTLLLNERQVHNLIAELEVRRLANQDPNVHYLLLTDLPDSVEKPQNRDADPLVLLAGRLIEELNGRYADSHRGSFLILHRHRVFNPKQGVWMGWERKRGKLLDLNRLIMGGMDCFPYKAGNIAALDGVRYVLTVDSDTKLPRDSVHRMVGAMAHPLNCAILDPHSRIVTKGYGILQPRVGITVHSVAKSRLAAIYSGQTGFDIYTRAISDVYQDLYGEGIFTGKGLYEISVLHQVMDRRFPQNSLLSHDLIEGAYARAGLLSDVEVMDDYPSHYSAQNRRKHRWVRGDWQILRWLWNRVPDDAGRQVQNPISTISRWKIFDNLRRSLVEPVTFLLLVIGWLWLPGTAGYWTIATLLIVFIPVAVQFLFALMRATFSEQKGYVPQSIRDSMALLFSTALNFAFLAHQTLLMADAIVRSLVRSFVTGERLLEWETAAEAENGINKRTPVEMTMQFVPFLSLAVGLLVWRVRPDALGWACPILVLWAFAQPITLWLNRSPHDMEINFSFSDTAFLRKIAWRTWLYFDRFSTEAGHHLVPDNVQMAEDGRGFREAMRLSPTNAGLQLNARQSAVAMGYLTVAEFAERTLANLRTLDQLPKWRGHLLNWYTTDTLQPIAPYIASTVDSGNFLASLLTLCHGTLELLRTPMLANLREGLLDVLADSAEVSPWSKQIQAALRPEKMEGEDARNGAWLQALLSSEIPLCPANALESRVHAVAKLVSGYLPWLDPKFSMLANFPPVSPDALYSYSPESALTACHQYQAMLQSQQQAISAEAVSLLTEFTAALHNAEQHLTHLIANLNAIAAWSERMFQATDYKPLLDPYRRLLTIGYDTEKGRRLDSCYDLLASEARTAAFLAIGKGDILQETWFKAARKTTLVDGNPVLLSWSGTMFEYMMPTLWMQTSPDTLLAQSLPGAIQAQREAVPSRRIPWGISEAGYSQRDPQGNYQYHAFGVRALALNPPPRDALVIAPYASLLALEIDPMGVLENLRRMEKMGWLGEFGFYESADYSRDRQPQDGSKSVLVRSWMAHHQGMSLLAITNLLTGKPFHRWFHRDPRVRATELLLHEKPIQVVPPADAPQKANVRFRPVISPEPVA
jgi:hypothetical protein